MNNRDKNFWVFDRMVPKVKENSNFIWLGLKKFEMHS